ncbi:hypothetical protein SIPHO067v1_p0028 [Vibrio phage 51E28.1]|nr:hypothetical protein SIPHO068v1_p0073 [Vibrio phage 51E28.4]QZI92868.1 hypothetical protein SIPHO067v1_p0028 [Vibrio phage 51E28.1]
MAVKMCKVVGAGLCLIDEDDRIICTAEEAAKAYLSVTKAKETAEFYQKCSGNKSTLKFGYSRVIEELEGK